MKEYQLKDVKWRRERGIGKKGSRLHGRREANFDPERFSLQP